MQTYKYKIGDIVIPNTQNVWYGKITSCHMRRGTVKVPEVPTPVYWLDAYDEYARPLMSRDGHHNGRFWPESAIVGFAPEDIRFVIDMGE